MELKMATMRSVRQDVKRGMTPGDFCEKYGCDEAELKTRLRQLFNGHAGHKRDVASEVFADMVANKKKPRRGPGKSADTKGPPPDTMLEQSFGDVVVESVGVKFVADVSEVLAGAAPEALVAAEVAPEMTLADYRVREENLREEICELERKQQGLRAGQREKIADVRALQAEVERMAAELTEMRGRFVTAADAYSALTKEARELSAKKDALSTELMEVRAKICELDVVTLFVYGDGRIEAVDRPNFYINDTGFIELNTRLLRKLDFDDLKVRDVRILARIICVVQNAPEEMKISVVFETPELEKAYQEYMFKL